MGEAEVQRRRGEGRQERIARAGVVDRAEAATAAEKAAGSQEADYAAYKKATGKSARGLGGKAAFERWKAARGRTAQEAGDALAASE